MTQLTEIQTVEAFGVPYVEQRYQPEPEIEERQLITIEFAPPLHPADGYGYRHPAFVFLETVAIRAQLTDCLNKGLDLTEYLELYEIEAIHLTVPRTSDGRLTEAPRWSYGIRCQIGTKELIWFKEDELLSRRDVYGEFEEF